MSERYIIDDCGSLIDTETRDTYDYVSDVCELLNKEDKKLKEIESFVQNCNVYVDDLKNIIFEIRRIIR